MLSSPVGLKEASLDSPTFRATAVHFCDQIDAIEKWLDGHLLRSANKLLQEATAMEGAINTFLNNSAPPKMSEGILSDYTLLSIHLHGSNSRKFFSNVFAGFKQTQKMVIDPVKVFLNTDLRQFKDARRQLEHTQRFYDNLSSRYFSQSKAKEASALREDAFQVHAARVAYLKASMEFSEIAPHLRAHLDRLLIDLFCDQWTNWRQVHGNSEDILGLNQAEFGRIQNWVRENAMGEKLFAKELSTAKSEIEERTIVNIRPSDKLDEYTMSTVPQVGARPPTTSSQSSGMSKASLASKQGWIYLRTVSGKPARTIWVRRWAFVRNGTFGWLVQGMRSGGVEESEKIGVLLCSVRPAAQEDRRFCFEVKTKDTAVMLQAETQSDLMEWIAAFDVAKQKALDEPLVTNATSLNGRPAIDTAFAVTPAIATELAAKRADGQISTISEEVASTLLPSEPEQLNPIASRSSFDVSPLRKVTSDHDSESTRERIAQKLGLHRESNASAAQPAGSQSAISSPSNIGGIASLISSAHSVLPIGVTRPTPTLTSRPEDDLPTSSLAPPTLVNPPSATSLSRTAVFVGMEKSLDLGLVDALGGTPSGLMANHWGSYNYGYLSRRDSSLSDRSDATRTRSRVNTTSSMMDSPRSPEGAFETMSADASIQSSTATPGKGHRKTLSTSDQPVAKQRSISAGLPDFYPAALKAHDAQFRLLFPNVPPEERIVLVFRATLDLNDQQDVPGTVFLTIDNMYFYSNYLGFVLLSNISLYKIGNVTAVANQDHDTIYFHLKHRPNREDATTLLNVKVYLEPLALLRDRLSYLVTNAGADEPASLEEVVRMLISLESPGNRSRPGADAWVASADQRTISQSELPKNSHKLQLNAAYSGLTAAPIDGSNLRFRLPSQAVEYVPPNFTIKAAEKEVDVSAKALYHIIFGDKSAMSQMLYRERSSQTVKQYPWTKLDQDRFVRDFEFTVGTIDSMYRSTEVSVRDSQTIDIANDHLCYVVSDIKTPWHLPFPRDYRLTSKIVITHAAKSQCKLAIYVKVDWIRKPLFFWHIINTRALHDLRTDALALVALVTDQVQKLGPNRHTKRAIAIFGHIGYTTEVASIVSAEPIQQSSLPPSELKNTTLAALLTHAIISNILDLITSAISACQTLLKHLNAHSVLSMILLGSLLIHLLSASAGIAAWRQQRAADAFMERLGAHPPGAMKRAVYLRDLDNATTAIPTLQHLPRTKWSVPNHHPTSQLLPH